MKRCTLAHGDMRFHDSRETAFEVICKSFAREGRMPLDLTCLGECPGGLQLRGKTCADFRHCGHQGWAKCTANPWSASKVVDSVAVTCWNG